jgi:hypothetical protein
MNANGYKVLGYLAWQGGKWYLRRRLPSSQTSALAGLAALSLTGAAAVAARRFAT